ncbi:hypothetical protein [Paraburkholderia sp. HD33-4]|uniref:hypothetical protein n=1 Tax=Paraburkholderia sp. HD33-4 TaxID=2883242 RepID=UPI001F47ADD8|nr:hypothetical protein [Paraburkholderia sp. HD33-4]
MARISAGPAPSRDGDRPRRGLIVRQAWLEGYFKAGLTPAEGAILFSGVVH